MARQRYIWPQFWDNEHIGVLSAEERLLFIALFSLADDEGRLKGSAAFLRGMVFKYSEKVTIAQVQKWRDVILKTCPESVMVYRAGSDEYIQLLRWGKWQKPKYPVPSKFPAPPGEPGEDSSNPPGELPEDSSTRGDELRGDELRGDEEGEEGKPSPNPPKIKYADRVTMTEAEYGKLVEQYEELRAKEMIKALDNYKGANGKKYKSDYCAILNWVAGKVLGYMPIRETAQEIDIPKQTLKQLFKCTKCQHEQFDDGKCSKCGNAVLIRSRMVYDETDNVVQFPKKTDPP